MNVIRWKSKRRGEPQKPTLAPKLPGTFYVALKPNRQLASSRSARLTMTLLPLAERFEMDVVYPEAKPRKGIWEKAQGQIQREAKKIVAEHFKRRRKENGPYKFASKPHLQKYAGFVADDVEIEPDADEDRIFAVLGAIGLGDEFEPIRNAAYDEYGLDARTRHWGGRLPLLISRHRQMLRQQTWRNYARRSKPVNQSRSGI